MRRTKANRALTFVMAAALLIGSIHGVGAKEQSKDYDAPELTLVQGASDYDLTAGITYDSEKYILSVTDTGNFDINVVGDYEISYTLTGKENSVKETESVESTEITENTEVTKSTEAVSGTEMVADTETGEDTGTLPEGNDSVDGADGADISEPDNADESTDVEEPDGDTVNITEEQTPKAANESQKVINFSRTVKVVAAEEPVETYAVNDGVATYANVQGSYTVNLGTPEWTDGTQKKFRYTNVKINTGSDDISLMTITLSNGKLPDDILKDATIKDATGKSATWIFPDKKSSQEIQKKIQTMTFDYTANMNVYVTINGNDNEGFDNINNNMKLTQWSVNGHYYLYVPEKLSWTKAYNRAMGFKLAGQQGYLATTTRTDEIDYLLNLNSTATWTAGTRLVRANGSLLNNDKIQPLSSGVLKYRNTTYAGDINQYKTHYYWAAGPEAGQTVTQNLWNSGEPNECVQAATGMSDNTLSDIQQYESCTMLMVQEKSLNDIREGNLRDNTSITAQGFFVEFGGYNNGADPGQPDNTKEGDTNVQVVLKDVEAVINDAKYLPLADALDMAKAYDVVEIIKDKVTAVNNATLKKDVQLKSNGRTFVYKGNVDSKIDVAEDGTVTVTGGSVNVTGDTTLKVKSPADSQTYQITTPSGATDVIVPDTPGGDKTPYVMNKNTTDALSLKIGDVTYTYTNQSFDNITLVYIPDAMYKNELVTKAEVQADKTAVIKLDDTNTVETKGGGSASDKVIVERRTTDKKADVKIPAGASADVFGHEVGAAPTNGMTVSQSSTTNSDYPSRDYVTLTPGERVVIDGVTYRATDSVKKFYLGTFNTTITTGNNAEIFGTKPNDPGYLQQYTVKITPKTNFDLDKDNFTVTMKKSDTGVAETLKFSDVCNVEADGSITVTILQVTGDITIHAAAKRQLTTLNVAGLTAGGAKGSFKAVDASGNTYKMEADGSIQVDRNEELTLTFTPNDFEDKYYSDLTGEKGESFSILTALEDTTDNNNNLFTTATFNWTEKSYEIKYTPTKADVTLKATFTPSHIVHFHVTGGTAEVTDQTLVTKETGAAQFQHVIVADDGTVDVKLTDTTANGLKPMAYWSDVSESPENAGADVSTQIQNVGGQTYTYTTQNVKQPKALNVTFGEGQTVEVMVNNGKLLNDDGAWRESSGTYTRIVKNNSSLVINIKPNDGYGLKSITVNGYPIDIEQAVEDKLLEYDSATGIYTHTTHGIYQAWKVAVDMEKQHQFIFEDQNGAEINNGESITVIEGGTIAETVFAKMQKETDKLKADNESFFVWVDKANTGKVYNETTVISSQTAEKVTLIPVYRTNVIEGADGSSIAADDFVIHVNDVGKLTAIDAKNRANVKAYDANGNDITANVTVDQDKLNELTAKGKGIYAAALTFQAGTGVATSITVEVTDDNPTVIGKTAHTLTFMGRPKTEYNVQERDTSGNLVGNVLRFTTDENGKGIAVNLKKATEYQISHSNFGSTVGKTSLVDAADIAKQFEDKGADDTKSNNRTDASEKAENSNVTVIVGDDGNYKVIVKKDIDHTVEIPDTWGNVTIDLNGKTITGDNATDTDKAKPGLEFVKDGSINEHPGTNLTVINGTIKGGDGSEKHPDGAAGIGTAEDPENPENAGVTVGKDGNIIGGNGADTRDEAAGSASKGGDGGAGIEGDITPTVNGGSVTGGNGGKGSDSATGKPGDGGNGGAGITTDNKVTIIEGTVSGGNGGAGGNATGDNKNDGGNGGTGGSGVDGGGDIIIGPGTDKPDISGGNGGNGGNSNNGNGGTGGNGGNGTETDGKTENNGGNISGGNGGNGGNSENGNGGTGGNGGSGSKGETENNGGNTSGGSGGNGGDSNNGNGGTGGNGGSGTDGKTENNGGNITGGNGGNGGNSNNGTGGNGGNGGTGENGNGGNGNSGNTNGGNKGNNGGNNNGNNGNNGGNNGGNSNGNTNGTNTGVTDGKTNATDIAAADGNHVSGGNKNNKHNRNNRNNNGSDPADGEDVTEGTETGTDTGSDDTTDVADSTDTGAGADDSIPADSSDADGHISFADCGFHWYPIILILVIAGYTGVRIKKIREELDEEY
ncbi:MAG: hypothetical protein BHW47_01650 [Roseburia inulinivorans]|nr:MAG: hypothetical protein BHW47_01650 [Roseburia inulinivorans]